jgi:hypothetical protein
MKKLDELLSDAARSSETGSAPLDALFEGARGDGFTSVETGALWNRIGAAVGVPGGPADSSGSAAAATSGGILKVAAAWVIAGSLTMGGAGVATVGVAARALHRSMLPVQSAQSIPASTLDSTPYVSTAGPSVAPPGRLPGAAAPLATQRSADVVRGPDMPSAAGRPQRATIEAAGRADAPSRSAAAGRPEADGTGTAARSDPGVEPRSALTASPAPVAGPLQAGTAPSPSEPAAGEGALLLRARQVLTSDPAAALALTQQHALRFPTGTLVPEREVLAIEALVELGRVSEARSRFAAFRARYPQSPHRARLEALLAR